MFKIYPDKCVQNQIILKSSTLQNKVIFTIVESSLEIVQWEMHMKIPKIAIKNIYVDDIPKNNVKKIFLKLENSINMEYILFSNDLEYKKIKDFFKEFK